MPTIDWSKPIEVYAYNDGKTVADAEVMASDLKGTHPYAVLWHLPDMDRVSLSTEGGKLYDKSWWGVRNKPVVNRKWAILSVTKAGELVFDSRETKEAAVKFREYRMGTGKYVLCNVVGLEWTEE